MRIIHGVLGKKELRSVTTNYNSKGIRALRRETLFLSTLKIEKEGEKENRAIRRDSRILFVIPRVYTNLIQL